MKRSLLFLFAAVLAVVALLLVPRPDTGNRAAAAARSPGDAPRDPSAHAAATPSPNPAAAPPIPSAPAVPDFQKITTFNDWAARWKDADAATRATMRAEGVRLAEVRRPEFKALIVADPQRALEQAVPRVLRQELPPEIVDLLERPVSAVGDFKVYRGRPAPGTVAPPSGLTLRYFETPQGASYRAHVPPALQAANSRKDLPLRGVAIDREFAVAESPLRQLEVGERLPANAQVEQTCPVSGETTAAVAPEEPVTEETPVVEVGERFILLCNGTHVRVLDEQYREAAGQLEAAGSGGAGYFFDAYPGTSSEAIGNFRCLYIRITYPDQMRAPNTEDSAYGDMRNVSRFFLENSFGKLTTTSVVTPLIVLPHSQAWYIAKDSEVDGLGLVHSHARSEARKLGYDSNQFNCTIVRVNGGPRLSGISWGGGDSVWVSWDGMDVLNHECGHSLGRNHANFWNTSDGTAYGAGSNAEYGNSFDVMGGGGGFGAHYNTISKNALGWLPNAYVHLPTANGTFRIFAYDQPQLEDGRRYAFRVAKDNARTYHLEYHPAIGGQWPNGALVMYRWSGMSNAGHLLDTTPGSPGGKGDGGIRVGRTYSDPESQQHFTVLSKNATTPPSIDLAYQRGPFPGNQPPTVALAASATSISAGGSITFTATASDPDGDPLAYHWDFSDSVATTSTPVFTRSFPSVDQMTVMVTASDMKGGVARRHVVVNVGNHGRHVVTGQVTAGGQPLAGVRIVAGSKYCFTDDAGNYALSDLTSGAQTLTATLAGYTFTPQFTNPLTVAAGTNTAHWTAGAVTLVTLEKTADAVEGGATGAFTLTRTGDTSAALAVRVAQVSGTATRTTDYTFSPDYVDDGVFRTFTIPAGQAALTVNVQAVNDTAAEGPETVVLQLASNTGYFTIGQSLAVMTVEDNDTTLPQVSVLATTPYAAEAPAEAGVFTFTRTGATTDPLALAVTFSGSATNGSDYALLPATVTIPAGQASVDVAVNPLNDATIETPEDCVVTIASHAAYVRAPSQQTATVTISDDDSAVVSVTALDADAAEQGRDPGVFLISRTGSTAAPLKVYYGLSGSALHGTDYIALPGEIVIPAGATSVPVIVTPYDDEQGEPETQSVVLSLTTFSSAYSLGTSFSATVNITDNDDAPIVSVRAGSTVASEPSTNGSFVFRATGSASGNVLVHYTVSGTATAGSDYTALSGTVTLPASGSNEVTVNLPVLDDSEIEDTETVVVTIVPQAGYRVFNDGSALVRLRDNENAERVMVSSWNSAPTEGGTTGRFYFSRGGTAGDLTVSYAVSGTATNGADYTALPGTATIPDGASGVDVTITPTNDTLVEGTETITLAVVAGAGYGVDLPGSATMYLADNETMPVTVGFASATGTTSEAPGANGEFRDVAVTLSTASSQEVTVEFTSNGGTASGDDIDWTYVDAAAGNAPIAGGVLTFPPGVTTQNVRIRVRNDGVVEGSETAILDLRNPRFAGLTSGRNRHTLTITDANDPVRRVRFLVNATTRSETEGSEPLLMAVLDRAATSPEVTVDFSVSGTATAGSDYQLAPGTLTFAAGESVKLLPLVILTDAVTESPETIVVTLGNPTNAELGAPVAHTVTLRESTRPAVSIVAATPQVAENGGPALFTVSRAGAGTAIPVTVFYSVGGTAAVGVDYTAPSGSVVIPAGADSAPLAITLLDDADEEPAEALVVTLLPDAAYDLAAAQEASVTLLDDDAPPAVVIHSPARPDTAIPPGVGLLLRAEATRTAPEGTTSVPVTWSKVSGPAEVTFEAQDATFTAATFAGTGTYVLRATATHGTSSGVADQIVRVGATLTAQTIGTTTAAGSWSEADSVPGSAQGGTITLIGAGTGLSSSGTSDGFYFLAAPVSGDFDVRCRVVSMSNPGGSNSCRFGIMVRASNAANAPYAMTMYRGNTSHAFQARLTAGADPYDSLGSTSYPLPHWLRLVRSGDEFSAFYSEDGATWTQRGTTQNIAAMGAAPLLGLALTSAVTATASTTVFDNLNFTLPTNTGPFVEAGAALAGSGPWNLDATVSDDGRPAPASIAPLWLVAEGPGTATFASASSIDTAVTFAASGVYRLRLTASDGAVTTFDETTADVVAGSPLLAWRETHFGSSANSGDAADDFDFDRDGLTNLVEYALGTDPTKRNASPLDVTPGAAQWVFAFPRDPARTDVTLTLRGSTDLAGWVPLARSEGGGPFASLAPEAEVSESGLGPVSVTITVTTSPPQRFFHLRAESTAP